MRLINKGSTPRYSSLANITLRPGCASRDMDTFAKAIDGFVQGTRGFDVILSDRDVELLAGLCVKYLLPAFKELNPEKDASLSKLRDTLADPDGVKVIREAYKARTVAIQRARAKVMEEARRKEERIQAESNIIGPDGNPIPKVEMKAAAAGDVKPELHPEMSTDLKSIIANNLAVMTTASGQPIRSAHDVVAKPGGSPVSHNPKDYQKPRTAPPGQPEYFK